MNFGNDPMGDTCFMGHVVDFGVYLFVTGHLLSIPHCEPDKSDPRFSELAR